MKQSLLVAALLAVALSACGKKEEAPAVDNSTTTIQSPEPSSEAPPAMPGSASDTVSAPPVGDSSQPATDMAPAN